MKNAFIYVRISVEDQSAYSLDYQERGDRDYCIRHNLNPVNVFIDNGESSYTFDRGQWNKLERQIKQNKIEYIIVYHLDRFSRNLADALTKIKELLQIGVKVRAINEHFELDDYSPDTFISRAIGFMMAEKELLGIRKRTKDGITEATKAGRFVHKAPLGYLNVQYSSKDKAIVIDEDKAPLIKTIYKEYLNGSSIEDIRRTVNALGFKPKGNSAITRVLSNPVYAGLLKLDNGFVKAIHTPIVTEQNFWKVQERLNGKKITTQKREEVPLRGVLRCWCGRLVTAGNSRSKSGKYHWYYLCKTHRNNLPAVKLHDQFNALLDNLSLSNEDIETIKNMLSIELGKILQDKGTKIKKVEKDLSIIQGKINTAEEKYLLNPDMSKATYQKVINSLNEDKSRILAEKALLDTDVEVYYNRLNDLLPKLSQLTTYFNAMSLIQQQQLINVVFDNSLFYENNSYRTPSVIDVFAHKSLELKEKGLLVIEQPLSISGETPMCRAQGSLVEQLAILAEIFAELVA